VGVAGLQVQELPAGTSHAWTFWTGITEPAQRQFINICQCCPTLRGLAIVHQGVPGAPLDAQLTLCWGFTRARLAAQESVTAIGGRSFRLHIYKVLPIGAEAQSPGALSPELTLPR